MRGKADGGASDHTGKIAMRTLVLVSTFILGFLAPAFAAEPERRTWTVDSVEREALVYVPAEATRDAAKSKSAPLVFVFHGHGGTTDRFH